MKSRPKTSIVNNEFTIMTRCFPNGRWITHYFKVRRGGHVVLNDASFHAGRREATEAHYFYRSMYDALENTPAGSYPQKLAAGFIHR